MKFPGPGSGLVSVVLDDRDRSSLWRFQTQMSCQIHLVSVHTFFFSKFTNLSHCNPCKEAARNQKGSTDNADMTSQATGPKDENITSSRLSPFRTSQGTLRTSPTSAGKTHRLTTYFWNSGLGNPLQEVIRVAKQQNQNQHCPLSPTLPPPIPAASPNTSSVTKQGKQRSSKITIAEDTASNAAAASSGTA